MCIRDRPGSDHASIATHAKIEEMLAEEGTSRWELGREKFLERAWEWKAKYGHIITDQLKKIGASCDWSRERFTMDEGCSRAVNEVFLRLYEKGLIYRGKYMVNFCPGCRTVIDVYKRQAHMMITPVARCLWSGYMMHRTALFNTLHLMEGEVRRNRQR